MPKQRIGGGDGDVTEYLIGLKHYNDKKRLDAINSLLRNGLKSIPANQVGELITGLGYGLSDEDEQVRVKCATFLLVLLNEFDQVVLQPFSQRLFIHIQAGISNVNADIRSSSVQFLGKMSCGEQFNEAEIEGLIKGLVELNNTVIPRARSKGNGSDLRQGLCKCMENLIESLQEKREDTERGVIDPSQWTISAIASRARSASSSTGSEIKKFLNSLERQGEDVMVERIKRVAVAAKLISEERQIESRERSTKPKKIGIFSRMSLLLNDDSD